MKMEGSDIRKRYSTFAEIRASSRKGRLFYEAESPLCQTGIFSKKIFFKLYTTLYNAVLLGYAKNPPEYTQTVNKEYVAKPCLKISSYQNPKGFAFSFTTRFKQRPIRLIH
jgi:hypothetical protein